MIPRNRRNQTEWVKKEIQNALDKGIPVTIDGEAYIQAEEDLSLVAENGCYMTDYISDDTGKIVQINFEQIE